MWTQRRRQGGEDGEDLSPEKERNGSSNDDGEGRLRENKGLRKMTATTTMMKKKEKENKRSKILIRPLAPIPS